MHNIYENESGCVFSYKLRYIAGFGSAEMAISTNPKTTIYRNLYENTSPGLQGLVMMADIIIIIQNDNTVQKSPVYED